MKITRLAFDSEDDGKGNPLLFAFVHGRGSWTGSTRDDALLWLATFAQEQKRKGRTVEAWATNLEYDLVNLYGPERVRELRLQFGRSALCGAQWRGRNVIFRDTMRHLPASVESLGELVGIAKLEKDLFDAKRKPTAAQLRRRCVRDARITFRFASTLANIYASLGERPRMTLASSALHLWRARYFKRELYRPDDEVWEAALSAYHGGRTEVFALGEHANVTVVDAASMFPWAMTAGPFPVPWGSWERVSDWHGPQGLYRARFEVPQGPLPRLPYRSADGTVYPVGTFVGWYTGEDVLGAARAGARVTIYRGFKFAEAVEPFREYVRDLFALKARSRGPLRMIYKTLLNCLYGKFGQQGRRIEAVPLEALEAMERRPDDWWIWNGLAIFTRDGVPPPWSNNLWSAIVTARARQRLGDEIERVARLGARPIYCDTDSVVFNGRSLRYPANAKRAGTFEKRGVYRRCVVVGKKEYALEDSDGRWHLTAKGIPARARDAYLRDGVAEFERPVRMREAMRAGTQANVWRTFRKQRRTTHGERSSLPDGTLLPVLIRE